MKEQHFLGKVATKAIISRGDEILLTRDHNDPDIWDLPGGRINIGESIKAAVEREVFEELGVKVEYDCLIYSEQLVHALDGNQHLFLTCKVNLIDVQQSFNVPSEELAEIKWVNQKTLAKIKIYDNCSRALEYYWSR